MLSLGYAPRFNPNNLSALLRRNAEGVDDVSLTASATLKDGLATVSTVVKEQVTINRIPPPPSALPHYERKRADTRLQASR
ncbi:MAG: hypothetical protein ACI8Z5_002558 [Lentimonas sp.]|jgi:hypothetical protein